MRSPRTKRLGRMQQGARQIIRTEMGVRDQLAAGDSDGEPGKKKIGVNPHHLIITRFRFVKESHNWDSSSREHCKSQYQSKEKATVVERTYSKLNIRQTLIPIDIDIIIMPVLAQT
jgi:hypothetical protein